MWNVNYSTIIKIASKIPITRCLVIESDKKPVLKYLLHTDAVGGTSVV